jgi:hypothetical protein
MSTDKCKGSGNLCAQCGDYQKICPHKKGDK